MHQNGFEIVSRFLTVLLCLLEEPTVVSERQRSSHHATFPASFLLRLCQISIGFWNMAQFLDASPCTYHDVRGHFYLRIYGHKYQIEA